jgi:hypothetical protein
MKSLLLPLLNASSRSRTRLLLAGWLAGVAVMAAGIADSQRSSRVALEDRFASRVDTAARFVGAYTTQTLDAEAASPVRTWPAAPT